MKTGFHIRAVGIEVVYLMRQADPRFVPQNGTPLSEPRFAIIVSSKVDKRATRRNRMKRLVREALQDLLPFITKGFCAVFVVRSRLPDTEEEVRELIHNTLNTLNTHWILKGSTT